MIRRIHHTLAIGLLIALLFTLCPCMTVGAAQEEHMLHDCDSTKGWDKGSVDTKVKTQGNGSISLDFKPSSTSNMIIYCTFPKVNATGCNTLEFDLYVSHPELFEQAGECAIELTSGGICDVEECFWYPDDEPLVKGWNHIALLIKDNTCKMSELDFFRIYAVNLNKFTRETVTVKIDNLRVTKTDPSDFGPTVPAENLGSLKEAGDKQANAVPNLEPEIGSETVIATFGVPLYHTCAIILFSVAGACLIAFILLMIFKKKRIALIAAILCFALAIGGGIFLYLFATVQQCKEVTHEVVIPLEAQSYIDELLRVDPDFNRKESKHGKILYEVGATSDTVTDEKWNFRTPTVIESALIPDQYVVALTTVQAFGAKGDGIADDTQAFIKAIRFVSGAGGGTIFVPAGHYCITESLNLPRGVVLCGELEPGTANGTVLRIYHGKWNPKAAPTFTMDFQSGIKNMAFWYPEQTFVNGEPIPYPYTIRQGHSEGILLENLNFVNAYRAIDMQSDVPNSNSLQTVRDIYGTPLVLGTDNTHSLDIGRFEGIHFSADYWLKSGLPGTPGRQLLANWLLRNATGIRIGRVDWTYYTDVNIDGYGIGIEYYIGPTGSSNGHLYNAKITNCYYPLYVECLSHLSYTSVTLSAVGNDGATAIYFKRTSKTELNLNHCTIESAGKNAIYNPSPSNISFLACSVSSVDGSPMVITKNASYTAVNTTFVGKDAEAYRSVSTEVDPLPTVDYDRTVITKPASNKLVDLSAEPYSIQNGTDITKTLQSAIDSLKSTGGTVYIPAGNFTVSAAITVHAGIELCGAQDVPHYFPSTTISTNYGENDPNGDALITLMEGAGMRGIGIKYDKIATHGAKIPPYAYTVRGNGKNIYIVNCTIPFTYNGVDFATYRCDNHYIEYLWGCAASNGIQVGGGSENGIIRDCMFTQNTSWTVKGDSSYIGTIQPILLSKSVTFRVGETKNQIVYHTFVFAAHKGLEITDGAENCIVISHGTDYGDNAIYLSGNSTVTLIDPQMVAYSGNTRCYIQADKSFKGRLTVYNGACWGMPASSFRLHGNADYRFYQIYLAATGDHVFTVDAGKLNAVAYVRSCESRIDFKLGESVTELTVNGAMCPSRLITAVPGSTKLSGNNLVK